MSFSSLGTTTSAHFALNTSMLEPRTKYSVSVGVYEGGMKRFSVSAFDLASRTGKP